MKTPPNPIIKDGTYFMFENGSLYFQSKDATWCQIRPSKPNLFNPEKKEIYRLLRLVVKKIK